MVRTMRGQQVDMARLMAENAHKVALGNASMNARGDIIDGHGKIMKSTEQITKEYNASNPKAVRQVALRNIDSEVLSPAEAVANYRALAMAEKAKRQRKIIDEPEEHTDNRVME